MNSVNDYVRVDGLSVCIENSMRRAPILKCDNIYPTLQYFCKRSNERNFVLFRNFQLQFLDKIVLEEQVGPIMIKTRINLIRLNKGIKRLGTR